TCSRKERPLGMRMRYYSWTIRRIAIDRQLPLLDGCASTKLRRGGWPASGIGLRNFLGQPGSHTDISARRQLKQTLLGISGQCQVSDKLTQGLLGDTFTAC